MGKVDLCIFTTFRVASQKTPSDFATPLMVFNVFSRLRKTLISLRNSNDFTRGDLCAKIDPKVFQTLTTLTTNTIDGTPTDPAMFNS